MDGYLSNKPDNFVDDPEKLYRLRRREAQQATSPIWCLWVFVMDLCLEWLS
jgi:hypothetical protein